MRQFSFQWQKNIGLCESKDGTALQHKASRLPLLACSCVSLHVAPMSKHRRLLWVMMG